MEILRDPIRLAFALVGPMMLMVAFGFGISFDVEDLPLRGPRPGPEPGEPRAARELRRLALLRGAAADRAMSPSWTERLQSGELKLALEIPPASAATCVRGRRPEVARLARRRHAVPRRDDARLCARASRCAIWPTAPSGRPGGAPPPPAVILETRFRYNQAFKSVYAMVPGVIMLDARADPRDDDGGRRGAREGDSARSPTSTRTPVTRPEFLLGKQAALRGHRLRQLPHPRPAGARRLRRARSRARAHRARRRRARSTCWRRPRFGLLMSSFARTQVAAIFGTAIITLIPP